MYLNEFNVLDRCQMCRRVAVIQFKRLISNLDARIFKGEVYMKTKCTSNRRKELRVLVRGV